MFLDKSIFYPDSLLLLIWLINTKQRCNSKRHCEPMKLHHDSGEAGER